MPVGFRVEIAGLSDRGLVRDGNEDSILVADLGLGEVLSDAPIHVVSGRRGPLLVLCDGMGGSVGGEIASSMACASIFSALAASPETAERAILARNLRRAVRLANLDIVAAAKADPALQGMGTTVSVAALAGNTLILAQVGDSRIYVLRGGELSQVTRDQSVVSALVNSGQLSEERAAYSMQRGRILQAVGTNPDVEVSVSIVDVLNGDRILLCSDGLHDVVPHESIAEACGALSLENVPAKLVALAHGGGGADNISAVVAEFSGGPDSPRTDDTAVAFTEFDPNLEGESALSTTSMVGRRLAHQAGIRRDPGPARMPATAQHPAITEDEFPGPAQRALASGRRLSPWLWCGLVLAALFMAVLAWVLA